MTLKDFIRQNRADLDAMFWEALRDPDYSINDGERRLWILNDEGLYR